MAPTPHVRIVPVEGEQLSFTLFIDGPDELVAPGDSAAVASPFKGKVFECVVKVAPEYPHVAPTDVLWKLGPGGKSTLFHPVRRRVGRDCSSGLSSAPSLPLTPHPLPPLLLRASR